MRKKSLAALGIALGLGLAFAHAETVKVPGGAAVQGQDGVPGRGLTMAQVEQRYGAPSDRMAAIGQPPITRWVYPAFVVYFEHDLVIHAVATKGAPAN
jgi:hypothetical protein